MQLKNIRIHGLITRLVLFLLDIFFWAKSAINNATIGIVTVHIDGRRF
jgi:hypothetical protein